MNYQQNIRNSSLRFVLKKVAIQLVTKWHECAKNRYDELGSRKFGYDELEVENDLVEYLSSAIEALVNNKSREKKSTLGWSFGYICGHAQGALNVKWSNQYLVEPSKEFDDLMKLKTIIELLKIDRDMPGKIEIIYSYFSTHRNETANEEVLPDNVITLVQSGKIRNENRGIYRKEFDEYFEKLFMTNYMSLLQTYDFMCCADLTEYFNESEMVNFVGKEHFA